MRRLMTKAAVCEAIGFKRSWLAAAIKAGKFPAPIEVFGQKRWDSEQVEAWIRSQVEQERVSA